MGILANIFGSGNVIEKGFNLIDSLHTSGEERIQAQSEAKVNLLKAYEPFKLAQRVLAFTFAGVFIASFFLVMYMTLFGEIGQAGIKEVMEVLGMFYIGEIMLMIIIFYFGGGATEGIITRFRAKREAT